LLRNVFQNLLRVLATRVVKRYKPTIIGITGSVGKTSTKDVIFDVLKRKYNVRKNEKNYNDQIGLPMTILGITPLEGPGIMPRLNLFDQLFVAIWLAYGFVQKYPEILVLEMGADTPGDIAYLTSIAPPTVGVVTAVGDVPVHIQYYSSPKAVAKEKSQILKNLPAQGGLAVINYDDDMVRHMDEETKAPTITFGFGEEADVWVSGISYFVVDDGSKIGGLAFKIHTYSTSSGRKGSFIPVRIHNMVGPHQIYSLLAATVVGTHLGVNLVDMAEVFERMEFTSGRMKLLRGIHDTIIIDDSYNSSPLATHAALVSLTAFVKAVRKLDRRRHRKVAILGDMSELGKYTESAHRSIGDFAGEIADVVIGVGNASIFIVEQAEKKLGDKRVLHFATSHDAAQAVKDIIKERDVILVKGSQSQRMEFVVKVLMAEPHRAKQLLVRQTDRWL
jgi:UDP-N-acetylmuramyl pentapeptide synthase